MNGECLFKGGEVHKGCLQLHFELLHTLYSLQSMDAIFMCIQICFDISLRHLIRTFLMWCSFWFLIFEFSRIEFFLLAALIHLSLMLVIFLLTAPLFELFSWTRISLFYPNNHPQILIWLCRYDNFWHSFESSLHVVHSFDLVQL